MDPGCDLSYTMILPRSISGPVPDGYTAHLLPEYDREMVRTAGVP